MNKNREADIKEPVSSGTSPCGWYLATIIVEFSVVDGGTTVHKNLMLIQATDEEDAYRAAINIGQDHEATYRNPEQRLVTARFRGLAQLIKVYDELVHGAELTYSSQDSPSESEVRAMILSKDQLSVFKNA